MTPMPIKITIGGREFELSQAEDAIAVQGNLVPANWPTSPAECVRLFTSTTEMLCYQLKRHLGANWQKICKQTQEEKADNNPATLKINFAFTLDQSAPTVAAIAEHSLGFSVAHKTKGKPQTYDINQGTFDETLAKEPEIGAEEPTEATAGETQAELPPGDTSTPPEPENPATATESGQATPPDNVVEIGTASPTPENLDKPRRGRPKGSRNKQHTAAE